MTSDQTFGAGFIGLGNIGGPMAKRLLGWPGGLWVYDVVADATRAFEDAGARVADSVAEVAAHCAVISVMVRDDAQVREVVAEIVAHAHAGTVVAIHSTIAPATAAELAANVADAGVEIVDAPVSGGAMGAATGELAVMVGGTDDAVARCRAVFDGWSSLVAHMGPVGAGTRAKLARNLLHFVSFAAVGEAMRLAEAGGVDLVALGNVVRHSDKITGGPGAIMLRDTTEPIATDNGLHNIFLHARDLGVKDLRHAIELAGELHVATPLAREALPLLGDALGVPTGPDAP